MNLAMSRYIDLGVEQASDVLVLMSPLFYHAQAQTRSYKHLGIAMFCSIH